MEIFNLVLVLCIAGIFAGTLITFLLRVMMDAFGAHPLTDKEVLYFAGITFFSGGALALLA